MAENDPKAAPLGEEIAPSDKSIPQKQVVAQEGKPADDKTAPSIPDLKSSAQEKKPPESPPEKKVPEGKAAPPKSPKPGKPTVSPSPPKPNAGDKNKEGGDKSDKSPKPPPPEKPPKPQEMPGTGKKEQTVFLKISDLHAYHTFRTHPFQVKDNVEMQELSKEIGEIGIQHPLVVRPRLEGGYEIISGHRRQRASELAGFEKVPCIVRHYNDFEAFQAMKAANRQRPEPLPSEKARLLDLELEAIKCQGSRDEERQRPDGTPIEKGKRSNEIVAENNNMSVKKVQRYISLTKLNSALLDLVDAKKIAFIPAVELSSIRPEHQSYIAEVIESVGVTPSLAQAQLMRELDAKNKLNSDVIEGIMLDEKKREDKVIISSAELFKYFGPDKTPREMKEVIISLLEERAKSLGIAPPTQDQKEK